MSVIVVFGMYQRCHLTSLHFPTAHAIFHLLSPTGSPPIPLLPPTLGEIQRFLHILLHPENPVCCSRSWQLKADDPTRLGKNVVNA